MTRLIGVAWLALILSFLLNPCGILAAQSATKPAESVPDELRAAAEAEKAGQYETALERYQQFLKSQDPARLSPALEANIRTRIATDFFLLHRYAESLEALSPLFRDVQVRRQIPAQGWLIQGLAALELNQPAKAIAPLRRALELNPQSGTARLALGDALARSGHLEDAASEFEEQTKRTPDLPDAWYKLGLAYAQLAAEPATPASASISENFVLDQFSAEGLLSKGDAQHAALAVLRILRRAPDQPQLHADLGSALLDMGFPKAAEQEFRRELAGDPECLSARLGLIEVAILGDDWTQGLAAFRRLVATHPRGLERLLQLSPTGLLRQGWTEGKIRVPTALSDSMEAKVLASWLGDSEVSLKGLAASGAPCAEPLAKLKTPPGVWLTETCYQRLRDLLRVRKNLDSAEKIKLAEAEFRLGDFAAARREALKIFAQDPHNAWGTYWLKLSYSELAQDALAKVTTLNPNSARLHQMLAQYFTNRHNLPRAKAEYLAAIKLAPDLPDLHLGLGGVCFSNGDYADAEKEFLKVLQLDPGSALAAYQLGDTYIQMQRWEEAIDPLRRAATDPALAGRARLDLSKAEDELGRTQNALDDLLPAADADRDGEIHYRLAALYRKLGDKAREKEALASFRELRVTSSGADQDELKALEALEQSPPKPPAESPQ